MDIFEEISRENKISPKAIEKGLNIYGNIFLRALDFFKKEGPKMNKHTFFPSNLEIWTVEGSLDKEYIVYHGLYCQCESFIINTIYRNKRYKPCKHLLALKIAKSLNKFEKINHSDEDWKNFIKEIK